MIKIGLTGGIGSGKSLISKVFLQMGVPIYDSDSATKQLYQTNIRLKKKIINEFGERSYKKDGLLDKKYLGKLIFNDKNKLQLINQIVHPIVKEDFNIWLNQNKEQPYIIKEAAILVESGAYKQLDKIIVVKSPLELRIKRVKKRDNTTKENVLKRIANQMPEEKLLKYADFIVENSDNRAILPQVLDIHAKLLKMLSFS